MAMFVIGLIIGTAVGVVAVAVYKNLRSGKNEA